jgi:type I restriction enzyme, S subunit
MSLLDVDLPRGRMWSTVGAAYEVTRKPRGLDLSRFGEVPFAAMEAIPQGGAYLPDFTVKARDAIASGIYFERGDILVGKITPSFENGKQAFVEHLATPFGFATTEVIPLRPREGGHDPRLLFFYLLHPDVRSYVAERMEGSTGRQRVPEAVLLDLPFPTFDPSDEGAIADVLEVVKSLAAFEAKQEQAGKALKRAAMRALFTRGLRGEAQKETEIGLVPESWEVVKLGDISNIERGRFLHRPRNEPRFYGGDTPFVQTGDVVRSGGRIRDFTQTLNAEGVGISRVFPAGTILITIAANIGYTGILGFDSACPDSLVAITPNEIVSAEFLEYWLQTQQPDMDRFAPKGTQKNINIQFLLPWPVVVPTLNEQRDIVDILDSIDRKIDLHRHKRAVLDDLFKALLHKLMTGEIRVGDLDLSALQQREAAA